MSLSDCLDKAGLDEAAKAELMSQEDIPKFLDQKEKDALRRKELIQLGKVAHEQSLSKIMSHPKGAIVGLRSLVVNDLSGLASWSNIEYRVKAIEGQAHSRMTDVIAELSNTMFGLKKGNQALADDVIREIMGTVTGNKNAAKLARQWNEVSETLRLRFNKAGGDIRKLDTWGMPQSHAQHKVFGAGFEEWEKFIRPRIDNADDIDLRYVYETISTGGLNKVKEPTPLAGGKMTANMHQEARILHFKDGDAWLEYNKRFGNTDDPLSVMLDHIRGMSQDIGAVEILGPNPDLLFKTLHKEAIHEAKKAQQQLDIAKRDGIKMSRQEKRELKQRASQGYEWYTQALYDVATGKIDQSAAVTKADKTLESTFALARNTQTATKLGSATLSALTDTSTLFTASALHGVKPYKVLNTAIKNLTPVYGLDKQKQIARLGFALDVFNSSITSRFDDVGKGQSAKVAEAVMRATGMNRWTEALRKAWQFEFYNHLSDLQVKAKGTNKLPKVYKDYGWTLDEVKALDFDNLKLDQQTRLLEMVGQEGDYAVMMPNARARSVVTLGQRKGTFAGELTRTAMQFKTFPATFMIQQMGRTFMQTNMSAGNRFAYGTSLFVLSTVLGGLSMMAKDKSKGYKETRKGAPSFEEGLFPEDSGKFWAAAAMQGGGIGIFGDLLFSDQSRYGSSVGAMMTGPTVSTIERAVKLTKGNADQALGDKDTHFGSEAVDFVNREMNPLNFWYTKAAIDLLVVENLKEMFDPSYAKSRARKNRKRMKEYGQTKADTLYEIYLGD